MPSVRSQRIERLSRRLAVFVMLLGGTVVLGRVLHWPLLANALPGTPMKMNTALCLIALGGALFLSSPAAPERRARARVLAGAAGLVALATLLEYVLGVSLGIDELVHRERFFEGGPLPPGRMTPNTALALLLGALALLTLDHAGSRRWKPAQILAVLVLGIAGFSLLERLYRINTGGTLLHLRQMTVYTAVGLAALAAGALCARPDTGALATLLRRAPGGRTARLLLPIMVIVPVALGWLRTQGERAGWYDSVFGAATMTTATVMLLCGVILWHARGLNRLHDAQRAAEHRQSAAEAQLTSTNRFLDAVIDNLPAMVFMKDAERLAFTRINRAGEQLLGIERREMLGKTDFDFFPPEEARFFQQKDRETLRAGATVEIVEEPIETRGGRRWLRTKKVGVTGDDGKPTHLLGISEDITDRRAAEEALRVAKESAEAANRELQAFSYSVSHDLRSPLRSIDGFSQALLEDAADTLTPECRGYLQRIRAAASRMGQLIDDLIELSRVNRTELNLSAVNLSDIAREIASDLSRTAPDREVTFRIEPQLLLQGDPRLLRIALENLLGNAFKFTSKRRSALIELGQGEPVSGTRRFFVRDNGAGFDMSYSQKLFGPFQRLHGSAEFEGTGIGLATVQRILHRHGGTISAEGAVDKGATFTVTLPERAEIQ